MKSEIVQLILSLTPSERREFKIRNGAESDFVKVLDYVIKYKSADYAELRLFFEKNYPERTTKFTSGYFSSVVAYLQQKILEIITQSDKKYPYVACALHLQKSYSLAIRGVYGLALQELETCRVIAEQYSMIEELIIVNRQRYLINSFQRYQNTSPDEFEKVVTSSQNLVKDLVLQHKYGYLAGKSAMHFYLQSFDTSLTNAYEAVPDDAPETHYFWVQLMYAITKSNKEMLAGNLLEGFKIYEKSFDMWYQQNQMIQILPRLFFINAQFYFNWAIYMPSDDSHYRNKIEQLERVLQTEKANFYSDFDVQLCDELLLVIRFWLMRMDGKYAEITTKMTADQVAQYSDEHTRIYFLFSLSFSYFQLGMYDEALRLIDPIIEGDYDFKSNNYVFVKMILLRILIYMDKKDHKFVTYLLRNAEYVFAKHNFDFEYEKHFISLIKKMIGKRFESNRNEILQEYKEKIELQIQSQNDYLMLSEWIMKQLYKK